MVIDSIVVEQWKEGFVLEYTIWKYLRENYQKLGFSQLLKKKKSVGGDFKMMWQGRDVLVEVENSWINYLGHGHPESEKFREVEILVCLQDGTYPSSCDLAKLPKTILFISKREFGNWIEKREATFQNC